jgi:hypothetical protein
MDPQSFAEIIRKRFRSVRRAVAFRNWNPSYLFEKDPIKRARILLEQKRYEKARHIAEKLAGTSPTDEGVLLLCGAIGRTTRDPLLWFQAYETIRSLDNPDLLMQIFNDPTSVFHPYAAGTDKREECERFNRACELIGRGEFSSALTHLESMKPLSQAQWQVIGAQANCYWNLRDPRFTGSLTSLGAANFHAPEIIDLLKQASDSGNKIYVLLAPEKTGNQSVLHSIVNSGQFLTFLVLQHTLNDNLTKARAHAASRHKWGTMYNNLQTETVYKDFLFNYHLAKERPLVIITMTREPIGMELSRYFFLTENIFGQRAEASISSFLRFMHNEFNSAESPLTWFDRELKGNFGIDIYSSPFDRSDGYKIYRSKNIEILVMTLEKMNQSFERAFYELLGIKGIKLNRQNLGVAFGYAEKYKRLKQELKLDEQELNRIYAKARLDHFYSDSDIDTFRAKWQG